MFRSCSCLRLGVIHIAKNRLRPLLLWSPISRRNSPHRIMRFGRPRPISRSRKRQPRSRSVMTAAAARWQAELNLSYAAITAAGILQILTAQRSYELAELGVAQARAQRLRDTVALYLASGSG